MRTAPHSTRPVVTLRQRREPVFGSSPLKMFDVETFIETVKVCPALYNVNHKYYNKKEVRARLWDEIGQKMYPEWRSFDARDKNEKVTIMQKKWKSLKDSFNRENRLQRTSDPKKFRKKYEFYDRLSFLLRNHNPVPIVALKEVRVKQENPTPDARPPTQSFNLSIPQIAAKPNAVRPPEVNSAKRKVRDEEELPPALKQKPQRRVEEAEDGERLFLLSFVSDLKRLPFATKYWVKMKFSEIMHQAAMSLDGCQEAEYASTSVEYDQEVGSPGNSYQAEYLEDAGSPNPSSSEIYELCQN